MNQEHIINQQESNLSSLQEHTVEETTHQEAGQTHSAAVGAHEDGGHEITLYAEPVFYIKSFPVTNSLITSWVAVLIIIILSLAIRLKLRKIPGVFQSSVEKIIEEALKMMDLVTNDRQKSEKIFPIVFTIFIFILINNWLGLVPGIGSISFNGHHIFRGGTADLNTTLTLGVFSVLAANIFGIMMTGFWTHFNKFINLKALLEIPGKIIKESTIILVNPITFFVGLIEIVGEIAKIASLSFRLFGNVFAGEVLLSSISVLAAYFVPLPFMFLELIVGIVQALIFAVLALVYFTIASMEHEH